MRNAVKVTLGDVTAEREATRLLEASEMRYPWRTDELIASARSSSFVCVIGTRTSWSG